MSNLDINNAVTSDNANQIDEFNIGIVGTDGPSAQKETKYSNPYFNKYWTMFLTHPELKSAIIMKAIWNVGKGYTTDPETKILLDNIKGIGKDTFDDILFNMEIIRRINGDAYAEIMRDDEGEVVNIKPLDPSTIDTIVDGKGLIIRYEQRSKVGKIKSVSNKVLGTSFGVIKFQPKDIFHLMNNRGADSIHGISDIESLNDNLLAELESFNDTRKLMHSQAKPFIIFKLKTDDTTKINNFVTKVGECRNNGDDLFLPDDENLVSYEVVQINPSAFILNWRQEVTNRFYRALGLPLILFGGSSGSTESGGKMEYYAHEQVFERDQRYIEKQVWNQLALKIDLIPPQSMAQNLATDEAKDANQGLEIQPSDTTAGVGR